MAYVYISDMRNPAKTITLEKLNQLFTLADGQLTWKRTSRNKVVQAGDPAGRVHNKGYAIVLIDRKPYAVHRIVYQMHHQLEVLPAEVLIDHINGDRADNRVENIRVCTHGQNMQNKTKHRNNRLGEKNIHFSRISHRYCVTVKGNGIKATRSFPGTEEGFELAKQFRDRMLLEVHGEFANLD